MNGPMAASDPGQRDLPRYSYLLRLWRAGRARSEFWRASLEEPHSGRKFGFANLEQLFAFIMERTERETTPSQADHNTPTNTSLSE